MFGYYPNFKTGSQTHTSLGQEFVHPYSYTDDRSTHPYGYSPFFHWKSSDWKSTDHSNYDDRLRQWKYDEWDEGCRTIERRFERNSPEAMSKMLSTFFGEEVKCTALVL